jgi:hypothetical protein
MYKTVLMKYLKGKIIDSLKRNWLIPFFHYLSNYTLYKTINNGT